MEKWSRNIPKRGYTLIIAEKPRAAAKIAWALGLRNRGKLYNVSYWSGYFRGRPIVVTSTAGHMYSLSANGRGYPVFSYSWVPRWNVEKGSSFLQRFYKAIKKLSDGASEFVNACDYDIEGSVIGYMIIKNIGSVNKAKRMKFSSLTPEELRKAFIRLEGMDWNMIEAGLCRHELDWIWGINVSRALMDIFKIVNGRWQVLSAGRVQSPTLSEVLKRHIDRETFVPIISFNISVTIEVNGKRYKLDNMFSPLTSLVKTREIAELLKKEKYLRVTDHKSEVKTLNPLPPFNLPDLQLEASRIYGLSPAETLRIAEDLYLDSLISYPRTNSQKLPKDLNNRSILNSLKKINTYTQLASKLLSKTHLRPAEGKKEDPAHPAIHPTGLTPRGILKPKHWKVYDLIVRRYMASFAESAKIATTRYTLSFKDIKFGLVGSKTITKGWLEYYPFVKVGERDVPDLRIGDSVKIKGVRVVKIYSKPPQRYSRTALLKWMEASGIGTEATRAEIIEVLFRRGYLKSSARYVEITDLGMNVAAALTKLFRELTSVNLTRKFEEYLEAVYRGKLQRIEVVKEAKDVLEPRLLELKKMVKEKKRDDFLRLLDMGNDLIKCELCSRAGKHRVNGLLLCNFHKKAYDSIVNAFKIWRERMDISWEEYIQQLRRLASVGRYCKDLLDRLSASTFKS
jgi:DNA topoisomerase-1